MITTEQGIMILQSLVSIGSVYGIIKTRVEYLSKRINELKDLNDRVVRLEEKINFIITKLKLQ